MVPDGGETAAAAAAAVTAGVGAAVGRQDDPSVDAWLRPVLYAIRLSFLPIIVAGTVTQADPYRGRGLDRARRSLLYLFRVSSWPAR